MSCRYRDDVIGGWRRYVSLTHDDDDYRLNVSRNAQKHQSHSTIAVTMRAAEIALAFFF